MRLSGVCCVVVIFSISEYSFGGTIYSISFDYKKAVPASSYFYGKPKSEIDHLCKTGEHAGTADMAACAQRDFEDTSGKLNAVVISEDDNYKINDIELRANHYPLALQRFKQAQRAWATYRDSQCYAETYSLGQASMRYMMFWDCMTRITKARLKELTTPDGEE